MHFVCLNCTSYNIGVVIDSTLKYQAIQSIDFILAVKEIIYKSVILQHISTEKYGKTEDFREYTV